MKRYRYIIIGGGMAGGRACEGIRQVDSEGSIALAASEPHRPYERPPLSKVYLRGEAGLEKVYLKPEDYYREQRVDLLEGMRVERIDPVHRQVGLDSGESLEYEKLLLATGGRARRLPLPGADLRNVFTLRTIDDSDGIRAASAPGRNALVMGGSFIGAEVAASLSQMEARVTLVFPDERLFSRVMPTELSQFFHSQFEAHGVRLLPGVTARSLEGDVLVQRAHLDNGETLETGLVVMGVGIDLNTELAVQAGLETQEKDHAVIVDGTLRTSDPHIYAAGDIAAWPDSTFNKRLRVEHWDVARRQGLQAGRNMAGAGEAYTALPNFFSDIYDLTFDVWGDLSKWEDTLLRGTLESRKFALFYFEGGSLAGALAMGLPKEEQKAIQSLVKSRARRGEIADRLADVNRPLAELAREADSAKASS
jgi:3-phenylpropionate/trans-cinnamate dioxygenase ferredoxin reductase subunit